MPLLTADLTHTKPDYAGGSIVNLMRSIGDRLGVAPNGYAPLRLLDERGAHAKRIVLLVIDGLGAQYIESVGANSVFARHQLGSMTSVYPPTTASAITTFMSGTAPQQHALTGWFMHFRKLGIVSAVLPFMPRFAPCALSNAGIDIGAVVECESFFDQLPGASAALLPAAICDSEFSTLLGGKSLRHSYESLDDFARQLKRMCEVDEGADFVYAYWSDFDRLSHLYGPSSEAVATHFAALDEALASVFEVCGNSDTLLVCTADHGFIDSGPAEQVRLEDHPGLADTLTLPLCGEPRSAYCYVRRRAERTFEAYVANELNDVAVAIPSEQLIAEGWFGNGLAHPELAARVGDYTLQMRERFTVADRLIGERKFRMQGVHGGTSAAEMRVPLCIAN